MGGGAWPFLVGGAICLVNSDNERDSSLLNRWRVLSLNFGFGVRRDQGWRCSSAVRPGCWGMESLRPFRRFRRFCFSAIEGVPWECGVGPPAVGFVLASVTTLLRGTSGVQPRDSEQ